MSEYETAQASFEACETGLGWAACGAQCHTDATFFFQADALIDVECIDRHRECLGTIEVDPYLVYMQSERH